MHPKALASAFLASSLLAAQLGARILIVPSDAQSSAGAVKAVQALLPGSDVTPLQELPKGLEGAQAVIALGGPAATGAYPAKMPLVVAMVYDPSVRPAGDYVRISMLPDAFFLLGKIRDIIPRLDRLGVLVKADNYKDYLKYLAAAGKITGTKLVTGKADDAAGLVGALRAMAGNVDALWVAPDPAFIKSDRFKLIGDFCLANKIALIAPLTVLARTGALAGIAPSDAQAGTAAAEAARDLAAGKAVDKLVQLERCEVLISGATAKALGFTVAARAGTLIE